MFRGMRRKDREMDSEAALALLCEAEYGVLATVGSEGYPYGVPLSHVYMNGRLYFHTATDGAKLEAIARDNRVCFTVVGQTELLPDEFSVRFASVIVFGRAAEIGGDEKRAALLAIAARYAAGSANDPGAYIDGAGQRTRVFAVDIDHISGKARR